MRGAITLISAEREITFLVVLHRGKKTRENTGFGLQELQKRVVSNPRKIMNTFILFLWNDGFNISLCL